MAYKVVDQWSGKVATTTVAEVSRLPWVALIGGLAMLGAVVGVVVVAKKK